MIDKTLKCLYFHKIFLIAIGFMVGGFLGLAVADSYRYPFTIATCGAFVFFTGAVVNSWFHSKQNIIFRILIMATFFQIGMNSLLNIDYYLFNCKFLRNPYINLAFVNTFTYLRSLLMWAVIAFIIMIIDDAMAYYVFRFRGRPTYYLDTRVLFKLPRRKDDQDDDKDVR